MDITNAVYIIYHITTGNVQFVARHSIGRDLTRDELQIVEHHLGDNIDWAEAIELCIREYC